MMQIVAELTGATKTYGTGEQSFTALRSVDLTVHAGEILMLEGPSGSGKTTCLSLMGCVLRASSGQVTVLGEDMTSLSDTELARRRLSAVGFIFQTHNLLSSLTALENVAMLGRLRALTRREALRTATALLSSMGLASRCHALPADLSGGERQRVAIARALIGGPPLILADEPTASLDAKNGLAVTQILAGLAKQEGRAVVVVTHDARISHLADRRIHIEDGMITREAA